MPRHERRARHAEHRRSHLNVPVEQLRVEEHEDGYCPDGPRQLLDAALPPLLLRCPAAAVALLLDDNAVVGHVPSSPLGSGRCRGCVSLSVGPVLLFVCKQEGARGSFHSNTTCSSRLLCDTRHGLLGRRLVLKPLDGFGGRAAFGKESSHHLLAIGLPADCRRRGPTRKSTRKLCENEDT